MLTRTKPRKRAFKTFTVSAIDVLHAKMHAYNKEAREILSYLIEQVKIQNKNSPALKSLYQLMQKADDVVIDCASKLAPYQSPKLESIEVKNKVEHRFVLRAPKQIASVDDWAKITGAKTLTAEEMEKKAKELAPMEPSIHDFDEDTDDERLRNSAERDADTKERMIPSGKLH